MSSLAALLYDPTSPRYDETLYLPFVEAAMGSDSLPAAERDRLAFACEQIRKNYPGTAATDFSYCDVEGRAHHLRGLYDTSPILIFFFRLRTAVKGVIVCAENKSPPFQISRMLHFGALGHKLVILRLYRLKTFSFNRSQNIL